MTRASIVAALFVLASCNASTVLEESESVPLASNMMLLAQGPNACVAGTWDATDYTANFKQTIEDNPNLAGIEKTWAKGHITYTLESTGTHSGTITAKAKKLRYKFEGEVNGVPVSVVLKFNGTKSGTYFVNNDRLIVAPATSDTMKVKTKIKIGGSKFKSVVPFYVGFAGAHPFTCNGNKLKVWSGAENRDGKPLKFKRNTEG